MSAETFDADWLSLREPVDHRSRPDELLLPLRKVWEERGWSRVLDLGSGTGSNLRYLAPRLPGPQAWTLLDHDRGLLARASPPLPHVKVERREGDLASEGLDAVGNAHLVTGSALLDLVSRSWLERLVDGCRSAGSGALFALSYNGVICWDQVSTAGEEPDDALVRRAVNLHQGGDKGLGAALGPEAAAVAGILFREAGFEVHITSAPWRLGPGDIPLVRELVAGWRNAALEARPEQEDTILRWAERRGRTLDSGAVDLTVGHMDLLALPAAGG